MALSQEEIVILWAQREPILTLRSARWILKYMWALPAAYILPLLASGFSTDLLVIILVGSFLYIVYAYFTYRTWNSYAKNHSRMRKRRTILAIMLFDALTLSLLSVAFFIAALLWFPAFFERVDYIGPAIAILYMAQAIFLIARGEAIVRYLIEAHERALAGETRIAIAIPISISAFGAAIAAILRTTPIATLVGGLMAATGAFLLLPFGITALYQVVILANHKGEAEIIHE